MMQFRQSIPGVVIGALIAGGVISGACSVNGSAEVGSGAPPPAVVEHEDNGSVVAVKDPDRFPLVAASERRAAPQLSVTGVVSPDVSRNVPVISLASGRVVELHARLGDEVRRGQLLLRVQSADISAASADHEKAIASEALARSQLERARALFERGAIARKDLEVAEDAERKAVVDANATAERLRVLGAGAAGSPTGVVDIVAPVSGVITEQNVTNASGVRTLDNSPNLFTISDLSHVWVVCDVYENDLRSVHLGDEAEIHPVAYPDRTLKGRVNNIGAILDPGLRTAKVRIEVANPGLLRIGMFVTATFRGRATQVHAVVPAAAVLHLHDREWVYVPRGERGVFERREVVAGPMLPGQMQELVSGLRPGERVVASALVLQNEAGQ